MSRSFVRFSMKYSSISCERVSGLGAAAMVVGPPQVWSRRRELAKHGYALPYQVLVDLVDVEPSADAAQHRDGQPPAEVLAELVEAAEDAGVALGMGQVAGQLGHEQLELDGAQQVDDAPPVIWREVAGQARVRGVQRDADRHRLAVSQPMAGQALQPVGSPVPEVERPA